MENIKALPLEELEVVGVISCVGEYETPDGDSRPEYELEYLNKALHNQATYSGSENRCACCGHALKLACLCVHRPTLQGYYIGRDCAAKVNRLQLFCPSIKYVSLALAERIACNKREADFLKAHSEVKDAYTYAKETSFAPKIAKDIVEKIRSYGDPSDKQIVLLVKLVTEDVNRRASIQEACPSGRQLVQGLVLGLKEKPGFGRHDDPTTKMLLELPTGIKVWGTVPASKVEEVTKGCVVAFTSTITPSKDDPAFGFVSRPANLRVVHQAPQVPV
jgi:hypothetical protein